MKVGELYIKLLELIEDGKINYDIVIRVADDDEKRDLITRINKIKSFSSKVGYVELTSVNNANIDWK